MSPPSVTPEWTVPAPPGRTRRIRPVRVLGGTGLALLGHVPTAWISLLVLYYSLGAFLEGGSFGLLLVPLAQVPLLVICVLVGILLLRFGDRGLGAGLIAGWGIGFVVTAVAAAVLATRWWSTCC
jgi:hypothetical protein